MDIEKLQGVWWNGPATIAISGDRFTTARMGAEYSGRVVLDEVSLKVQRGDRLAIIGPNGIGKSTLLKILMGLLEPDRGAVKWGYETHPGYFAQDHRELVGGSEDTIESWFWNYCPGQPIGFVRGRLAQVLFQKDEVGKRVSHLSGGEAARLIFARLGVTEPNVLVLDEPTNHLDLEAINALNVALQRFEGTVLLVTHDQDVMEEVGTRVWHFEGGTIHDFKGSYEEYASSLV